jgi:hypothetical protein
MVGAAALRQTEGVRLGRRMDHTIAWLTDLDTRAGVSPQASRRDGGATPVAAESGCWRKRPLFYWSHSWSSGDAFAVVLFVAGLVRRQHPSIRLATI